MTDDPINIILSLGRFLWSLWWLWLPLILFLLVKDIWLKNARQKLFEKMDWVLLEIKPPKEIQKTPKATEQIFAGLHGFQGTPNWWDRKIKGKVQDWFSFEMIGQAEQIRFFVRTRPLYRNFIEAQIYAQFPQAEIDQVDDYVQLVPKDIPSKDFDIWGTELMLIKEDAYPIRTYQAFEKDLLVEEQRIDPLASLSEVMSKLQPGEQIWIQTLVRPIDHKWVAESEKIRDKLAGRKKEKKRGLIAEEAVSWGTAVREVTSEIATGQISEGTSSKKESKPEPNPMTLMTKLEKDAITAVEEKMAKIGYETIIRFIYLAPTTIFAKPNAGAVIGCYKQFNTQDLNGFRPNPKVTTKIDYRIQLKKPREFARKKKILAAYQKREFVPQSKVVKYLRPLNFERWPLFKSFFIKSKPFILNTEELASIYHYPGLMAEAPTLPRVEAKKSGPPTGLPIG